MRVRLSAGWKSQAEPSAYIGYDVYSRRSNCDEQADALSVNSELVRSYSTETEPKEETLMFF